MSNADLKAKLDEWRGLNGQGDPKADSILAELLQAASPPVATPDPLTAARQALMALDGNADAAAIQAALAPVERPPAPPDPLPGETWPAEDPPDRNWLIKHWLPQGRLCSLYGTGGAGKSRLALQLAAAVMHGGPPVALARHVPADLRADYEAGGLCRPLAGPRPVLWLSWEDEADEIRRRWRMAELAGAIKNPHPDPDALTLVDMRKVGGSLWAPSGTGHVSNRGDWTVAGRRFLKTLRGHALAIVDPLAAAFLSSEIDRALVRAFAAALDAEAESSGCTILLIGHPPKDATHGYSGSTDWRNAVRAMLVLETSDQTGQTIQGDGKERKARAWRLRLDKSSYSTEGATVWLARHHAQTPFGNGLAWLATGAGEAARAHNPKARLKGPTPAGRKIDYGS